MTEGRRGILVGLVAGAAMAAVVVLRFGPAPAPIAQTVHVDPAVMEAKRPELERPSLGQKLTTGSVKPDQVAIATAPSAAGKKAVAAYCEPVVLLDRGTRVGISGRDSTVGRDSAPNVRAILPDFAGRRAGARLELYSTLNDGRRWQGQWTARGRISWESSGDTVLVRGDRLWTRLVRGTPRCAAHGAAAAGFGLLTGQEDLELAISGALGILACAL